MAPKSATGLIAKFSLMKFFPGDGAFRAALLDDLEKMINNDTEAAWLQYRVNQVFGEWPGVREIRALFCKRFRPKDKFEATSQLYPDGFPSEAELGPVPVVGLLPSRTEREALASAAIPSSRQLEGGAIASADPAADELVVDLVQQRAMPAVSRYYVATGDAQRVHNELRLLYGLPVKESEPEPEAVSLTPPAPEPRFAGNGRPRQIISREEVEAARQAELLRRKRRDVVSNEALASGQHEAPQEAS